MRRRKAAGGDKREIMKVQNNKMSVVVWLRSYGDIKLRLGQKGTQ